MVYNSGVLNRYTILEYLTVDGYKTNNMLGRQKFINVGRQIVNMELKRTEVTNDLLKIKDVINRPNKPVPHEVNQVLFQLRGLKQNINEIRDSLLPESSTKLKRKKQIIYLFKQHDSLTSSQLSELIQISRTRCTEYLKEMEKEGIVKGKIKKRKKFYELDI